MYSQESQNPVMQEGDDKLIVKFFMGSVEMPFKSEQEGRPIFESKPFITIITPGSRDSLTVPVNSVHKQRFPAAWSRFENSEAAHEELHGMPLREWPMVTRAQAEEMSFLNVFTVEQLADLSDTHGQKMMNFHELKRKAQAFVESAKDGAFVQKLTAENAKLQDQITMLQEQMQVLQTQVVGGSDGVSAGGASNRRK